MPDGPTAVESVPRPTPTSHDIAQLVLSGKSGQTVSSGSTSSTELSGLSGALGATAETPAGPIQVSIVERECHAAS